MVLESQLGIIAGLQVGTESEGLRLQLTQLRVAIAIMVVRGTVAALPKEVDTRLMIVRHQRGVHGRIIIRTASPDHRQRMGNLGRVAHRFLRDDIDRTGDSGRAEQGRASSAHHLYPLDHICRDLPQAIYAGQGAEDRPAIHQDLGIRAFQTIDTYLLETAILAVILHTHAGLEVQTVGQGSGVRSLEHLGVEYIYQRRSQTAGRLVTVCRYDDTVQGDSVFLGIEIDLQCLPFLKGHRLLLGFISDRLHDQGVFSLGKILHIVMTGSVGGRTDRRTVEVDIDKREMLSCFLIEDMAYDISVGRIQGGMIVSLCPR